MCCSIAKHWWYLVYIVTKFNIWYLILLYLGERGAFPKLKHALEVELLRGDLHIRSEEGLD